MPPAGILGREAGEKQVEMGPEIALDIDTRRFAARTIHLQMHGPGVTVPPASVTGLEFGAGPNRTDGLDRRRSATIEAELAGPTLGEASGRVHRLPVLEDVPKGVAEGVAGDAERMKELFTSFAFAIGTGILPVYAILVLLLRASGSPSRSSQPCRCRRAAPSVCFA